MDRYLSRRAAHQGKNGREPAISALACLTLTLILFAAFLAVLVVPSHGRKLTTFYRQASGEWVCDLLTNSRFRYVPPVTQTYTITDLEKRDSGLLEPGFLIPSHSPWDYGTAAGTVTKCYE